MYDSEYFRKVIGNNYNPNDLYANTTYNNNEGGRIYSVDAKPEIINNINTADTSVSTYDTNQSSMQPVNTIPSQVSTQSVNTIPNQVLEQPVNTISNQASTQPVNTMPNQVSTQPASTVVELDSTKPISEQTYTVSASAPTETYNVSAQPFEKNNKVRYPEIYNVLNPMVETILREKQNMEYNDATIDAMSTELYNALEADVNPTGMQNQVSTVNNVVEVNARPKNYLLHDLIKIMLISKIER